jgi:hypothetical protein
MEKRLAEGRAALPPCPLPTSSILKKKYVIARAQAEAISR